MTGRRRLLTAIRHQEADRVPASPRHVMAAAKAGGGFIIGSPDSFRDRTPRENIRACFRSCLRYGRYGG